MNSFDLGDLIVNPEPYVAASKLWLEANATLLAGSAVGALAVSGAAGFGVSRLMDRVRQNAEDRKRFGGPKEAAEAGLLRNPKLAYSGLPIGRLGRKRLCWVDQEPLLVTGGTRSGKGVGVIRPACLTYGGPMVMYDGGKGELFRDTSWWRSQFSHVLNFDLTDPNGVHYNFLDEIDPENPVGGADSLAKSVPKPENSDGHFEPAADRLIGAVILHVLHGEPDEKKNMGQVVKIISQGDNGMRRIAGEMAHDVAVDRINALFNGDPFSDNDDGSKYRGSVYNSALVRLSPFEDPVVAKVTSRSDFRMADLFRLSPAKRPVSLYLTTPANEDDRLAPVMSMFLTQLINAIMRDQPALDNEPRTVLVIDEFPSLRMEILQKAITKIVGCGATMILGAQSLNALSQKPYGPNNQFRDNIRCYIAFAANDGHTQREIAQSCGTVPETRKSHSKSRMAGSWQSSRSETESEAETPVLTPGKVRMIKDADEIILIRGQPVIRAKKIVDHEDRILKKRLKKKPAPMRGADGVYPGLPYPERPSVWAGVMTRNAIRVDGDDLDDVDGLETPVAQATPASRKPKPGAAPGHRGTNAAAVIVATSEPSLFPALELDVPPVPRKRKRKLAIAPETAE